MTEIEQLSQLCERLGAPPAQAAAMAAQLLTRADHLALQKCIAQLSQSVAQLERTVAAQSPLTAMFERFVIALVTGAVTYFITKEIR